MRSPSHGLRPALETEEKSSGGWDAAYCTVLYCEALTVSAIHVLLEEEIQGAQCGRRDPDFAAVLLLVSRYVGTRVVSVREKVEGVPASRNEATAGQRPFKGRMIAYDPLRHGSFRTDRRDGGGVASPKASQKRSE